MYSENNRGPKAEPCGTPEVSGVTSDDDCFHRTNVDRYSRYDCNHPRALPVKCMAEPSNHRIMVDAVECRRLVECHQNCRPMIVETIEDVIGDLEQCRLS